jgi:integrase
MGLLNGLDGLGSCKYCCKHIMASLTLKKDCKNYIACFTLPDGRRTNKSTGTTDKKLAQKLADEWEQASKEASKGQFNEARARKVLNDILRRAGEDTIHSDTVEVYLRDWLKGKDNEGTNERYTHSVDLFLASLGQKAQSYLSSVSHKDVLKFIKTRQDAGLAPKTILIDVKSLNIAFNLAKKLHIIQDNPVEKALALNPIKGKSMEKGAFTPEQVASILQAATGEWRTVILFGFFTGARLSDCAQMKWENVNLTEKLVDYVAGKTGNRTEQKQHTVLPLAPQLEAHLLELPSSDNPHSYITPELATKETRGRNGLSESFKAIMLKAGVDTIEVQGKGKRKFNRLTFHSLRHACNSLLANAGVDQETRMAIIGQKTKAINTGYTHLDLQKLRGAMDKLPKLKF